MPIPFVLDEHLRGKPIWNGIKRTISPILGATS
jgi:hypothetical protein